jgi:hypothetical protein
MPITPIDFLNKGESAVQATVVKSPAFSLTKVMAAVAPLVTLLTTAITSLVKDGNLKAFSTGQVTTLIVALVGFLAITGAADVLARALATSAETSGEAVKTSASTAANSRYRMVQFGKPLSAKLKMGPNGHQDVHVLAASDASPHEFLCLLEDESVAWSPASDVVFED